MYRLIGFCLSLTSVLHLSSGTSCVRTKKFYTMNGRYDDHEHLLCYNSKDFKADMKKAPQDTRKLVVEFADIPKLENNALATMPHLTDVDLVQCNIQDIEDDAFHGLNQLTFLDLSDNRLKTAKGVWFKNLNLEILILKANQIETIDEQFVNTMLGMKNLRSIQLLSNRLKKLPPYFGPLLDKGFVHLEFNPWTYKQGLEIATRVDGYYVYPGFDELRVFSHNASVACNDSLGMDVPDEIFDNCVNKIVIEQFKPTV